MATLTEFLLARIGEDEDGAQEIHDRGCVQFDATYTYPCDCGRPQRVLAECEAKRRIVGLHDELKIHGHLELHCTSCPGEDYPCQTLRQLATPYADHPHYLPGWRP